MISAGPSKNPKLGYDWAVVSGGPPTSPTLHGKCRTGDLIHTPLTGMHGEGLWLFTRNPIDPANTQAALNAADRFGFDIKQLKPVVHRGCLYGKPPPAGGAAERGKAQAQHAAAPAHASTPAHGATPTHAATPAHGSAPAPAAKPKLESAKQVTAPWSGEKAPVVPMVTRKVYFDLSQGGKDLGRVVLGL